MKSLPLIATVFGLFLVQLTWAHSTNTDWENLLRDQLHSALGNESFSIQSLQVAPSEKRLTGVGTFFKKEGVRFTVSYEGAEEIGSFEATMPSNANISVTHKEFRELAGQRLEQFLPDALQKSVYLEGFRIDFSQKERKAQSIHLLFNALNNWELFQGSQVALKQIKIRFEIDHPTEKAKRKTHGILTGLTTVAGKSVALEADLTSRKEELQLSGTTGDLSFQSSLQSLTSRSSIQGIDLPDNLISLELSAGTLTFAPYQKWITLRANSSWGEVDMWVQRPTTSKQKETAYLVTISPPEGFRLSQIHANLKALDGIDLSKQKIVLSSEEKSKEETSKIPGLSEMATYVSLRNNLGGDHLSSRRSKLPAI